ncbi:type III-A CRISPR-associated RAMP protein Csm5 [Staphylococcus intermedius]|uniref:CRISPR system Cms protein Csm5 n=3 Tax=Staphylococcus intermedius TaxID=1285 RepID=A0A380G5E7_STAIN|nr:type III-A CRISPR-associated RAMP protein Csm5 [Staphylococcus intermedius]PCF64183.1 type III-A CRISPR-associated RAMP protein Csm5 [Staphylococcus intermedius]PCF78898.1 type III-A CRISPR-associated RAMP protein Csm5 [Staphylococcus intermedius]PCF79870.1 type III-A CRISPR-associated RAMP protein Csm5 [Staphylococcus intermedius]PCF89470.1 type III-A CRISPR-associated RAMP protein Csm5 [Staphylococcus intermedius]SUM45503.1 Csm5 family CRISPR-associated RAMP protein [Staphylococcus interm
MGIKTYEVKLKMLGPVHIGDGSIRTKHEYIHDYYQSTVHVVDKVKFIQYLKGKNLLNKYLDFLKNPTKNFRESTLKFFLDQQKVKKSEWHKFVSFSQRVNLGKKENQKNSKKGLNDIHLMVRDGQKKVYIPGSSLKGALKTMIVAKYNNEDDKNYYSKIKVSDSLPIEERYLSIYQKIDINKKDVGMPVYRECIEVGTEVSFQISIEDEVISIESLESCIKDFYHNYYEKWLIGFKETHGGRLFEDGGGFPDTKKHNIIYIGGGVGFASKTLYYQRHNYTIAKQKTFNILKKRHKNPYAKMRRIPRNVPIVLKGTVNLAKNEYYQQGMCQISFNQK